MVLFSRAPPSSCSLGRGIDASPIGSVLLRYWSCLSDLQRIKSLHCNLAVRCMDAVTCVPISTTARRHDRRILNLLTVAWCWVVRHGANRRGGPLKNVGAVDV